MIKRMYFWMALGVALALAVAALPVTTPAEARILTPGASELSRQEGDDPLTYEDELLGLKVLLPAGWQALPGGQEYDLALVSPEALTGNTGAFVTLLNIPGLGPGTTLESALESVASQFDGAVEPLTLGAVEGFQVTYVDEAATGVQHLVLVPYGDQGEVFYIQTFASSEDDATVLALLEGLELAPPEPDYAEADAALQASLAEDGRLIYGDPDAPIKMVEFFSFTCSHCANYSFPLNRLIALEVESGRVQIELVPIAGDAFAARATSAAYCAAEQGAGYSANKALYVGYVNLGYQYAYSDEGIAEVLGGLDADLDMDALNTCIAEDTYAGAAEESRTRFTDYGLTGTPTILLGTADADIQPLMLPSGGGVWSGSIPVDTLRVIFDLITEEGVALENVIDELVASAQ